MNVAVPCGGKCGGKQPVHDIGSFLLVCILGVVFNGIVLCRFVVVGVVTVVNAEATSLKMLRR